MEPVGWMSSPTVKSETITKPYDGLERMFLSEMLKYAWPQQTSSGFGGGVGEEHFSSFLKDAYASQLAQRLALNLHISDMG
ncbi:hypothetical protein GCM10017635_16590 [Paracoccus kondratievae]|uniref:Flagellar protein FlgJ N-terminal domain-containing protein n=1 Tax=Paracoccus kondratievae TaxID=135740 RepID=A0AAD3NZN3_9RHOB|nr:hypothetical protein GCM10017635_16590 [Paracoccus kondratievae]